METPFGSPCNVNTLRCQCTAATPVRLHAMSIVNVDYMALILSDLPAPGRALHAARKDPSELELYVTLRPQNIVRM